MTSLLGLMILNGNISVDDLPVLIQATEQKLLCSSSVTPLSWRLLPGCAKGGCCGGMNGLMKQCDGGVCLAQQPTMVWFGSAIVAQGRVGGAGHFCGHFRVHVATSQNSQSMASCLSRKNSMSAV